MKNQFSLDDLWDATATGEAVEQQVEPRERTVAARRYLEHAIAPGTRPASAVRLKMHGEIKLKTWLPFTAEQVIRLDRGFIWTATVRQKGLPIHGADRMVDGVGAMQWKLLGILPVMVGSGPDITKSAVGRVLIESIWLPSFLIRPEVIWTETDVAHPHARFTLYNEPAELDLTIEATGSIRTICLPRWGNPEGGAFHYVPFGGVCEEEETFDGYTIPTKLRVGWYFGTERFEDDGEFFRATVDTVVYR